MAITRADFQHLADLRLQDAQRLLDAGQWDGAYYVAGYVVECALKACIIRSMVAADAFPDCKFSDNCYKHDLPLLLRVAELEEVLNLAGPVAKKWAAVKDWSEQSRYERGRTETQVRDFFDAITDPAEGVLPWLQTHW